MAWIDWIDESAATGRLKRIYERITAPWGGVDHILKIHSLNPRSMEGHWDLYKWLSKGRSPLSRAQREMIAVVVSATNGCHY